MTLKGKQLLVKVVVFLLISGALTYSNLPKAYCPLEDKTVRYVHMSDSRKTVTKVIPDDIESWKIADDRCQKGMEIGQWIPINEGLINNCQSSLEECQSREFELCGDCPAVEEKICPDAPLCPSLNGTCPAPPACVQTCQGCGGGGGSRDCPTLSCPPSINCDKVNVVAYIPNEDCSITEKWWCDDIGEDAACYTRDLEMPFD